MSLARFYILQERFEKAEQTLEECIQTHPSSFEPRFLLAELYVNQKASEKAIETLAAVPETGSRSSSSHDS